MLQTRRPGLGDEREREGRRRGRRAMLLRCAMAEAEHRAAADLHVRNSAVRLVAEFGTNDDRELLAERARRIRAMVQSGAATNDDHRDLTVIESALNCAREAGIALNFPGVPARSRFAMLQSPRASFHTKNQTRSFRYRS